MSACAGSGWRQRCTEAAIENLRRWNNLAAEDHAEVLLFLRGMLIC